MPQVVGNNRNRSKPIELLERAGLRPRQARNEPESYPEAVTGCAWDASFGLVAAESATLIVAFAQVFRAFRFPEATLNLRVGGSIPPRLTSSRFARTD